MQAIAKAPHFLLQPGIGIKSESAGNMNIALKVGGMALVGDYMEPVLRRSSSDADIDVGIRAINPVDAAKNEAVALRYAGTITDGGGIRDTVCAIGVGSNEAIVVF